MQYRREIDGLRAVAVLPVILYHAGFVVFSGGYIGVDVFFVISGYLITSILISDLEQKRLSIARFYERRARRILPALFLVMLACLPFAYMWMYPSQLEDFAQSLVAVVFFSSNFLFWSQSGYFAPAAELKPLLHTWSLAVEEQYYLLFPIFLMVLWRFGRQRVFWIVVTVAIISFLLAEWGWRNKPGANFYLIPTRAWELLAGSICAFMTVGNAQRSSDLLSAVGLALIICSIFFYDANTPFPSAYTLVPVVGTMLIILFAAKGTFVSYVLSLRAFVGVGLISYSAYLWHQPLFAFARIRSLTEPSLSLMAALAVASLLLAWATWYWVEQPFRKRTNPLLVTRRSVFAASGIVGSVFVSIGIVGHIQKGFEWKLDEKYLAALNVRSGLRDECHSFYDQVGIVQDICALGSDDSAISIAIIGDSHAARLSEALSDELDRLELSAATYTGDWCVPLINFTTKFPIWKKNCLDKTKAAFYQVLSTPTIKTVILHAEWANYTAGKRWAETAAPATYIYSEDGDFDYSKADASKNPLYFEAAVNRTVTDLVAQNKRVIIILPVPEHEHNVPASVTHLLFLGRDPNSMALPEADYHRRAGLVREVLLKAVDRYGIEVIDPFEIMCADGSCPISNSEGLPMYEDTNHLSYPGTVPIAAAIGQLLRD